MRRLCYSIIDRLNQGSVRQSLTSRIFFHQLTDHHTKEESENRLKGNNKETLQELAQ